MRSTQEFVLPIISVERLTENPVGSQPQDSVKRAVMARGRKAKTPKDQRPAWAQRLIALREASGKSQEALAQDAGIPQSTYQGYETGDSQPNFSQIENIASVIGVTPGTIAFGEGEPGNDGAFTGALIERYKQYEGFVPAFFQTTAMLQEERFNADLHTAVRIAIRLFEEAKASTDDADLRDRIHAAVVRERAKIRAEIDSIWKNRR